MLATWLERFTLINIEMHVDEGNAKFQGWSNISNIDK